MKFFRKLTESGWVITSSLVTLIAGIITTILNCYANGTIGFYILLGLFLTGISTILIQILVSSYITNELVNNINIENSGILLPHNVYLAQEELEKLVSSSGNNISAIKIICYGTSAYGDFLTDISNNVYKKAKNITVQAILCSSECVYRDSDKDEIERIRKFLSNSKNITLYESKELPTIRACVVYDKNNEAIWNCLQVYTYGGLPTAQYKTFYALVGNGKNDHLLKDNTDLIEREFERLKK